MGGGRREGRGRIGGWGGGSWLSAWYRGHTTAISPSLTTGAETRHHSAVTGPGQGPLKGAV